MHIIRDYSRGHHSPPMPIPFTPPTESEEAYEAHVRELFAQEDFLQLEKIAQQNRIEKGLLTGGGWKNFMFFNSLENPSCDCGLSDSDPIRPLQDSDYQKHLLKINNWIATHPDSAAAQLTLAHFYTSYASFARGDGLANTVSSSAWKLYSARSAKAKEILIAAARLKEQDPNWFFVMEQVAFEEGWRKDDARELLNQALAFEPSYYHYYREYANYLAPEWYGDRGEIQAFAEELAARFPDPEGSMLYFRVVSSLAINNTFEANELPNVSWPKLQKGYRNIQSFYGVSNLNANRFAYMAYTFKDIFIAHDAFGSIVTMVPAVWYDKKSFEAVRTWANCSEVFAQK